MSDGGRENNGARRRRRDRSTAKRSAEPGPEGEDAAGDGYPGPDALGATEADELDGELGRGVGRRDWRRVQEFKGSKVEGYRGTESQGYRGSFAVVDDVEDFADQGDGFVLDDDGRVGRVGAEEDEGTVAVHYPFDQRSLGFDSDHDQVVVFEASAAGRRDHDEVAVLNHAGHAVAFDAEAEGVGIVKNGSGEGEGAFGLFVDRGDTVFAGGDAA
jgi:hypothetical protein